MREDVIDNYMTDERARMPRGIVYEGLIAYAIFLRVIPADRLIGLRSSETDQWTLLGTVYPIACERSDDMEPCFGELSRCLLW